MKKAIITVAAAIGITAGIIGCISLSARTNSDTGSTDKAAGASSINAPSRYISQDDFIRTAEATVNGVVSVKSYATPRTGQSPDIYGGDIFDFFFGNPRQRRQLPRQQEKPSQQQLGLGSGVIISSDGYIVTNNHVIADAERLEVTLNDNRNFDAKVIGTDPQTDIALIKIEAPADLHVIPMGKSEDLRVGEWVLAVGNPFGFTSSVTSGIVSAKARNISSSVGGRPSGGIESYIQTDAALNSGNSGGALVNLSGELVGINTAIYSQTGTYAGCSFAIPVSIVQKVVKDLNDFGTVQRAYLGISFRELSPELVAKENIKGAVAGIYVAEVLDRSAALEAGLKPGDVVVALNDRPTLNTAQMQEAITSFSPGDKVTILYWRDGKKHTGTATLRNNRGETGLVRSDSAASLGASFAEIDNDTARRLEISHGVAVTEVSPDGRFADAGIREGFIILGINSRRISSPDEIKSIYDSIAKSDNSRDKVMFISGIYPTGKAAYYAVPLTD
ncbi:MAG: Do family serine endopeptidase [Muribaculaceae bacterium]|nr:Do family serine endopeptidase [Muribaculaceae bacterium]